MNLENWQKEIPALQNFILSKEGITELVEIPTEIVEDEENAKKLDGYTGHYDPSSRKITLYVTGRHPKDILRTWCHEFIHVLQDFKGKLQEIQTTDIRKDKTLLKVEGEAYLKGNIYFREYLEEQKMKKDNTPRVVSKIHEVLKKTQLLKENQEDELRDEVGEIHLVLKPDLQDTADTIQKTTTISDIYRSPEDFRKILHILTSKADANRIARKEIENRDRIIADIRKNIQLYKTQEIRLKKISQATQGHIDSLKYVDTPNTSV